MSQETWGQKNKLLCQRRPEKDLRGMREAGSSEPKFLGSGFFYLKTSLREGM